MKRSSPFCAGIPPIERDSNSDLGSQITFNSDFVSEVKRADPGRRSREDEVSRSQFPDSAQITYKKRYGENHISSISFLANLSVDDTFKGNIRQVYRIIIRQKFSQRRAAVKSL